MKTFFDYLTWKFHVFLIDHAPSWLPQEVLLWVELVATPDECCHSIETIRKELNCKLVD